MTYGWSAFGGADHGWQDIGLEGGAWPIPQADFSAFLRITRISDRRVVFEKKLKLTTEPLALVKISEKVHTALYDE